MTLTTDLDPDNFKANQHVKYIGQRSFTHTQQFYGSLDSVQDNTSEPVPEETLTHTHLSWTSVVPCLLPPSIMIHVILSAQLTYLTDLSTISLQVFFGLPLGLASSTSYSIYFFTQSLSSSQRSFNSQVIVPTNGQMHAHTRLIAQPASP